jgi:sulfonate transport system substrate-binding protein
LSENTSAGGAIQGGTKISTRWAGQVASPRHIAVAVASKSTATRYWVAVYSTLVTLFAIALCGCGDSGDGRGTTASGDSSAAASGGNLRQLRIGYQKSSLLLGLMRENHALEKRFAQRGIAVSWTEFPAGPQLLEGLNVGSIDFGHAGETPPVFAQAAGAPLLYVASEGHGAQSEAIVVAKDSPITRLADLKGKRVALQKGANVHFFLVRALEANGLQYTDIEPVFLPPADARVAFESGSVDAWAIWDPYFAAAELGAGARTLIDGKNLVENRGFYFASQALSQREPDALLTITEELELASAWSAAHSSEVVEFLAPRLGMPKVVLARCEARRRYGLEAIGAETIAYQQNVADTLLRLGLIPRAIVVAEAIWHAPAGAKPFEAAPEAAATSQHNGADESQPACCAPQSAAARFVGQVTSPELRKP